MSSNNLTIGIDLGDRRHSACVLTAGGEILAEAEIKNARECLTDFAQRYPGATFVMETDTHNPWVSQLLEALGHTVHVGIQVPRGVKATAFVRKFRSQAACPSFPHRSRPSGHCDLSSACARKAITSRQARPPFRTNRGFLPAPVTLTSPPRVRMEA